MQHVVRGWVLGVAAWAVLCSPGAAETLAARSFEVLRAQPPICLDHFDFVVLGDSAPMEPIALPEAFHQMIREWNALRPAFVIDNGDLILGGGAEGLGPQWDEFERVVAQCEVPFFPVPGNHDISCAVSEKIYEDRIGPLSYAFSYGNSRFIILNAEELDMAQRISDAQTAWLKQDLAKAKAKNIFLFLHEPFFAMDWDANWGNVAEAIHGYPVRAVFAGHWHYYRYWGERNGVQYIISGGGGSEVRAPEEEGGFEHYLLLRVRGTEVDWSVIRPGAVLPPEIVTQAQVDVARQLQNAMRTEPVEVLWGEGLDRTVKILLENPCAEPIVSTLRWHVPAGWQVAPAESAYAIAPGERLTIAVHVRAEGPEAVRFPAPSLVTELTPPGADKPVRIEKEMDLIPVIHSPYAVAPVLLDGDLGEWAHAAPVPLPYAYAFDIANTEDLKSQVRLMWDEGNVYIAVETEDDEFHQPYSGDIVWLADNVQFFLDQWEWGLSLTEKGPEVFMYKGPGRRSESVNQTARLAIRRDGRRTVYEAALPATEVAPLRLHEGQHYRFTIVMNDLDPSHPERPRHWAELTPGAGEARACPMAKVVLVR